MSKLLIIEDSLLIQKIIKHLATTDLNCEFDIAGTMAEAKQLINESEYFLALVDLHLPDAPRGEIVDIVLDANISTIILTASMDERRRVEMLNKGVLDYIYKENRESYISAVQLANRILLNKDTTVLVADDSKTIRNHIRSQLQKMLFTVIEAENGIEAKEALESNSNIGLLITDYNMPKMNGIELIRSIRRKHSRDEFPIIGLSSSMDDTLSAQFIKYGANDFLVMPFIHEEFQWRILKTMEQVSLFCKIRESANRDYLTKLYNRRYFYSIAEKRFAKIKSNCELLYIVLIDIDYFKKVNDVYGHDSGDAILVQLAIVMKLAFKNHLIARFGGEEFILLLHNVDKKECAVMLESFRRLVESTPLKTPDGTLSITVSMGVAEQTNIIKLDGLISIADSALYNAKESGRNKIVFAAQKSVK